MKTALYIILALATLMLYGWAMALYADTLVNPLPLVAVAIGLALLLWIPAKKLWERLLPQLNAFWRLTAHLAVETAVVLAAILAINYYGASKESTHTEKATVENRYTEQRHRTRRISRRIYTNSGEAYTVYFMVIRLDDGRSKTIQIDNRRYRQIRVGATVSLPVSRGLLGMPVTDLRKIQSNSGSKRRH